MPAPITIDAPTYPYLIREENRDARSLLRISTARFSDEGNKDLFILENGVLDYSGDAAAHHRIQVKHSWASDAEDDTARLAHFEVASLQLVSAWPNTVNFSAWLVSAPQFYPDTMPERNPFVGAVKLEGTTEHGYSRNTGYPYLPPVVNLGRRTYPMQVEIALTYALSPKRMRQWADDLLSKKA